jgi:calcineurin-like phosphoesterase family protein
MPNIFLTADTHLGHFNILKHCNRPYSSVEEMDTALISRWNDVVKDRDTIYILGDFAWRNPQDYVSQLHGKKILIRGSHDLHPERYFNEVYDIKSIKIDKQLIVMCHYPMRSWNGSSHNSIHCHGHEHGVLKMELLNSIDVGVDCWNYRPVSYEEIRKILSLGQREQVVL